MTEIEIRPTLLRARAELAAPARQLELLESLELGEGADFRVATNAAGLGDLRATGVDVLQVNVGKRCNQTCAHCHVDAGPERRESMSSETAARCIELLAATTIPTLDITGGAPEMNPSFRMLVEGARGLGRHVIDRCNLTILSTPVGADLPEFFAEHGVEVVCSLPHYRRSSTDKQRGRGVFERSIDGLRRLNEVGYGREEGLRLVLVTNPVGAFLPTGQASLEAEWKRELERLHGVRFDALYTITNMPIARYLEWLERSGNLERYLRELVTAFNPAAVGSVMCRTMVSVGWDGRLYDCDFNQMLELDLAEGTPRHLDDLDLIDDDPLAGLRTRPIRTARHCFGCTAGAGSSCGGALE